MSKYPTNYRRSGVIPLLGLAQRQCGNFLPVAACEKVARITDCSPQEVFEVASFYTMFNRTRVGKYFIQLCGTTPCMVCGSEEIKHTIEKHLSIKEGGTTPDGMFTLREVECLGACVNAPMVQINDDFFESLTPETTVEVLEACKAGKPPGLSKWGSRPMNGQISCEGPKGKSTLNGTPPPAGFKMRDIPKNEDPAGVKKHMMY